MQPDVVVRMKRRSCVPPVPEPTLLLETLRMEDDPTHGVEIASGFFVDRELVMREFSRAGEDAADAFARYRSTLLSQMLKRRWFAALTDHNTRALFLQRSPDFFVRFIGDVVGKVSSAIEEVAAGNGAEATALRSACDADAIRLVLKGTPSPPPVHARPLSTAFRGLG